MIKKQFDELGLSAEVQKALQDMGFEEATAIQTAIIPLMMERKDVIGHSQTGTGKTAAFGIPAVESIDMSVKVVQALIMCPTRELAIQVCEEIRKFCKYKQGIKCAAIYGGQPIERQIQVLKQGVQIVIGTPGRIIDHLRRHTLKLGFLSTVVLDEADEMLNMGFREDIETILKHTPEERQTVLFSATMPKAVMDITNNYQKDPELINVVHQQLTVSNIEQYYLEVPQGKKVEVFNRLMDIYNPKRSLMFCNTKRMVDELVNQLQLRGYMSDGIHGDMNQPARSRVMEAFKSGKIEILVATDVAARGIDVDNVEVVFNYDIPQDEEYYVHRIGRTGRAGKGGKAFTFVCGKWELYELKDIMKFTNSKIALMPSPSLDETKEIKENKLLGSLQKVLEAEELDKSMRIVDKLIDVEYTTADIAAAAIKMLMEREGNKVADDDFDMNEVFETRPGHKDRGRSKSGSKSGFKGGFKSGSKDGSKGGSKDGSKGGSKDGSKGGFRSSGQGNKNSVKYKGKSKDKDNYKSKRSKKSSDQEIF